MPFFLTLESLSSFSWQVFVGQKKMEKKIRKVRKEWYIKC
jgi:hypothetical protein